MNVCGSLQGFQGEKGEPGDRGPSGIDGMIGAPGMPGPPVRQYIYPSFSCCLYPGGLSPIHTADADATQLES